METLSSRVAREGGFAAADAVGWAVRLAKRIESLHVLGVAHGNVSGECVLIEGAQPAMRGVLGDVRRARPGRAYHSPERCAGAGISQADDAWAIGVALYLSLTGTLPFLAATEEELTRKIAGGSPSPLAVYDVGDDDLQRILDNLFARDGRASTQSVSALRRALEAWQPALRLQTLPPLDEEDDEDEEERENATVVAQSSVVQSMVAAARAAAAPVAAPPRAAAPPVATPPRAAPVAAPPRAAAPVAAPPRAAAPAAPPGGLMEDDDDAATVARGPSAARDFLDALMAQRAAASAPAPATPPPIAPPQPAAPVAAPPQFGRAPLSSSTALMPQPPAPSTGSALSGTFVMSGAHHAALADAIARGAAPEASQQAPVTPAAMPPNAPAMPPNAPAMPPNAMPPGAAAMPASPPIAAPPAKSRTGVLVAAAAVAVVAVVLVAGVMMMRRRGQSPPIPSPTVAVSVDAPPPPTAEPEVSAHAEASATPVAAPTAEPAASAVAPGAPASIGACVLTMFAAGTFDADLDKKADFVCSESDPKKGADALRTLTVGAGGGKHVVTDGMREWAVLGWYDMAGFAAIRGRCCPGAPPLAAATPVGECHIDAALADLSTAAAKGFPDGDKSIDDALAPYTTAIHCILRANLGDRFGRSEAIQGGEATAVKKTLARATPR